MTVAGNDTADGGSGDRVCVHGLGHIGLPTAAVLAEAGYDVAGYDVDETLLEGLERGEVDTTEPGLATAVRERVRDGSFTPVREVVPAAYHVICVPTDLTADEEADLSIVREAVVAIAEAVRPGDAVVLESTVPPGTTVGTVAPLVDDRSAVPIDDVRVVYSPETVLPGRAMEELRANDRLVGGVDLASIEAGVELYGSFVEGCLHGTDATTAEFAKLAQNTYRDVNIALANELARLGDDQGVDAREAIRLGNTHPRVDLHRPGPGPGGHCLPVDPWFLCQDAPPGTLIEHARRVNDDMAGYVAEVVTELLDDLAGRPVVVLGVAYKSNVADARNSPGRRVARVLEAQYGADVRLHDPHVREPAVASTTLSDAVGGADALVVATGHDEYRELSPERVHQWMRTPIAVDATETLDSAAWRRAGFNFARV